MWLPCAAQVLTIVSMLSVPSVFFRPPDRAEESDAAREKFFIPESDHLTLLHVYQQWKNNGYRADWCSSHFLQPKGERRKPKTLVAKCATLPVWMVLQPSDLSRARSDFFSARVCAEKLL